MAEVTRLTRMEIRLPEDLKQEYQEICESKNLNGSAVIRGFIEEFIEKNRPDKLRSFNLVEILWKLSGDLSINCSAEKHASLLGYDDQEALFNDVVEHLKAMADERNQCYQNKYGFYGKIVLNGEEVFFRVVNRKGEWCPIEPCWWQEMLDEQ